MKTETQNLIVTILGTYAIISLIGLYLMIVFAHTPSELTLALVPVTSTPISILGGFIAGKTMTEKENERYFESLDQSSAVESCSDEATEETISDEEGA
ncbi:MAG: hypothetical protein BZ138_07835 [Methanosphaera sp. rholeuAM270]|nr:MAG: hypothetical protein BZ138_07835 [Methanosphaera sp. rholeuAM270]